MSPQNSSFPNKNPYRMMQTRSGSCYPRSDKRGRRGGEGEEEVYRQKRHRTAAAAPCSASGDFFSGMPDDIVVSIICQLSSSASSPSDLVGILMTCKRLNCLGLNPLILSKASLKSLAIKAKNWCEQAHRFLKRCADSGNLEASYILGMIKFYCLQNRCSGTSLMAKAAIKSHATALYSLAIIQFNGSGGCRNDKDLRAGIALLARSAFLNHIDALRELGHCLQDGYGVRKNIAEGRRFLLQANAQELAAAVPPSQSKAVSRASLFSDFGCNVPAIESHPANRFLVDWFVSNPVGPELRLCSHGECGRPETRKHEFRRCSVCGKVNYCSRACQALHWKLVHKVECAPMDQELLHHDGDAAVT